MNKQVESWHRILVTVGMALSAEIFWKIEMRATVSLVQGPGSNQ